MKPPDIDNIPQTALDWIKAGKTAALATVIETWGSSPRPVGAQLVISGSGEITGSVSGGCVEAAVVAEALEALADGRVRLLEYGISDEEAFAVGLACGGTIRIMVEPVGIGEGPEITFLEQLVTSRNSRKPISCIVNTKTWQRRLSDGDNDPDMQARFADNKSGFTGDDFIGIHNPPIKMIIVGAVHIAQSLIPMAAIAGYDVTLVDPRTAFASDARFPGQHILNDWPDQALRAIGLDARTAIVTLSHDPKIDDPAILETLNSKAFYLGCLGSRRTHAKRLARLQETGLTNDQCARIHAPVGLNIGSKSPAEIAVSILAEITQELHRANTGEKRG